MLQNQLRCILNTFQKTSPSEDCESERYYRADSFIAATKMMQKVVEVSDDRKADLIVLAGLAEFTAYCVYGVEGPNTIFESRNGEIYMAENHQVRERYRFQKWSRIQRRVLAQLKDEFNYDGSGEEDARNDITVIASR